MSNLRPLEPRWTAPLFPRLGARLSELLRSMDAEDWERPTVCSGWTVRDIAAHLLDSCLRRVSADRDEFVRPPEPGEVTDYASLIGFLDRLNAEWVQAARRLSPALLIELLEFAEDRLAETLTRLEPEAPARFAVSWAGEEESKLWFDVARELTERWLHQQQIRLAVGAEPLDDPEISRAVLETFLRALPHRYREVEAEAGATVAILVRGAEPYEFALRCRGDGWDLLAGSSSEAIARVGVDEETAWLLLTKGLPGDAARERAEVDGPEALVSPFFDVIAVMA